MLSHADPSQVAGLSRFFKTGPGQYGEGDKFLGIKVPVTREVVKECWKSLGTPGSGHDGGDDGGGDGAGDRRGDGADDGRDDRGGFPELEECICSEYHEVRLAALLALVEIFRHAKKSTKQNSVTGRAGDLRQQCINFYLNHTRYINNWDLVDLSCYPLLGEWLMDKDRGILYDLARNGKTIWEQRIGIVSTMTFIRHGQLEDTFAIADILLHHPHDLIQKAVGWLLREAGKRDKAALEAYLKGSSCPRYLTMPRTALRYAIEKFPEQERLAYLRSTT